MSKADEMAWLRTAWEQSDQNMDTFCRRIAERLDYLETNVADLLDIIKYFRGAAENKEKDGEEMQDSAGKDPAPEDTS
jgi:hypothetical protein